MPESLYRRTPRHDPHANLKKRFRVGIANNPLPEDKWYSEEDAIERANKMANANFKQPIAVWNEADDIVHLFLCGQEFKPA